MEAWLVHYWVCCYMDLLIVPLLQALVEKDLVVSSVLPDSLQSLVEPLSSLADTPQVSVWEAVVLHVIHQCYFLVVYTFNLHH